MSEFYMLAGIIQAAIYSDPAPGAQANGRPHAVSRPTDAMAPLVFQGSYTAGISGSMDMGYIRGLASWSQTHIITYANGKRSLLTVNSGRWHGEPIRHAKPSKKASSTRRAA